MSQLTFSNDTSVQFWLPPQESGTHIAVVIGGKQPEIYINGQRQAYEKIEYEMEEYPSEANLRGEL